jgi:nucleotide-binding universal stress UspA family protein
MNKILKILVATDYSEAVMCAEHYAIQLGLNEGFTLRFLHVFESPVADQVGSFDAAKVDASPVAVELNRLKKHVRKILDSMGLEPKQVNYECVVREGAVTKQITEEVNESYPDFILMGTHGVSGFREFVLGSHTWQLIKQTAVPVFALPKDAFFTGIKNIVYATEFREGELPVINYLAQLASRFNARLTVLHITSSVITEEFEKKITSDFMHEVKERVDYPDVDFNVEHSTDIIRGIEDFTERYSADLLAISHEKPYFLERIFSPNSGTARKMSLHTKMPLLVIPDFYNPDFAWFWRLFAMDYSIDTDF